MVSGVFDSGLGANGKRLMIRQSVIVKQYLLIAVAGNVELG